MQLANASDYNERSRLRAELRELKKAAGLETEYVKKARNTSQYRRPGFQAERKVTINPTPTGIHKTVVDSKSPGGRKSSLTEAGSKSSTRSTTPLSPRDTTAVTTNGFKSPSPAVVVSPVAKQAPKEVSPPPREPTPQKEPTPEREPTPQREPTPEKQPTPPRDPTPPSASPEVDEASLSLEERQELLSKKVTWWKHVVNCHICG